MPAPRAQPGRVTSISPATGAAPPREQIAARAYEIWEEAGCPDGQHEAHWLQAERELRARSSR
ncbi:MAG TPA: DUF2934 domain-containing protein [Anaeromyxobacteraceae bacterium]|nr:DUF2934 domain-containing protein [Anaeromyxobacteraceae bacterium]